MIDFRETFIIIPANKTLKAFNIFDLIIFMKECENAVCKCCFKVKFYNALYFKIFKLHVEITLTHFDIYIQPIS